MLCHLFTAFFDVEAVERLDFYYSGEVSQPVIVSMGQALKRQLAIGDGQGTKTRKVFSAYVEMLQNVVRYAEGREGAVIVCQVAGEHLVACANRVAKRDADALKAKLETVLAASQEDVREAYRAQLRQAQIGADGGAGLGLLTLARESSKPMEYRFVDQVVDQDAAADGFCYFLLKATL